MPTPAEFLAFARPVLVALQAVCQVALAGYALHRLPMLLGSGARERPLPGPWWDAADAPRVLVQLPVRDEPAVVERLVAAAAALDWPRDRLEIQLLDDSGEANAALGAVAVATARARGVHVAHFRRESPHGFKAGALAAGLERSRAVFVAVFDADFVPPPDFLQRMLRHFGASDVGMVQARWGHLNREASALTRAQAVLLDAQQLLEHGWRQRSGRFLNFNGSAGVWRRAAIDAAGGWQHDTLSEDLDLSYRAQLAGWRFVFDPSVVVPAELPEHMSALLSQQRRWARGALQTARKLLPALLRAPLPASVKLEAFLHLSANVNYPLLLSLALLMVPVLAGESGPAPGASLWPLASVAVTLLPVVAFLERGAVLAGRRGAGRLLDTTAALVLSAGLSWQLTRAVFEGLWGPTGEFVRTPKSGAGVPRRARAEGPLSMPRASAGGAPELGFAAGFAAAAVWAGSSGGWGASPFLAALATGMAWVGARAFRAG